MGKIPLYFLVLTTLVVSATATYGVELSGELQQALRDNPSKVCTLINPVSDVIAKLPVPLGAQHKKEIVWRKETPSDFHAVLGLMQVASVAPCAMSDGGEAKLIIRAMRLIERDPATGVEQVVSAITDFSAKRENGSTVFAGKLFERIPHWYPADGKVSDPVDVTTVAGQALVIDLKKTPQFIFHGWTEPQVEAKPGMNYLVEMEVNIVGQARLQMGIDYWRSIGAKDLGWKEDCQATNHCEGHLSKWFGPTNGWKTIRTPDALLGKK